MEGLLLFALEVLLVGHVSVVHADQPGGTLYLERDFVVRIGMHAAFGVHHPGGDVSDVAPIRADDIAIHGKLKRGGVAGGRNLHLHRGLPGFGPHGSQRARFVEHVPGKMEIGRGPYAVLGLPRRRGATLAEPREDETLRAHGSSVEEQLHAVAIRVAGHGEVLALASFPVPVGKQAKHGLVGPLTLVEVETVLREAAAIDAAGRAASTGPAGFADVIDSGPHEIAGYVVVGTHEFPELLGVQPTEAAQLWKFRSEEHT